jgi:hypothetical protein
MTTKRDNCLSCGHHSPPLDSADVKEELVLSWDSLHDEFPLVEAQVVVSVLVESFRHLQDLVLQVIQLNCVGVGVGDDNVRGKGNDLELGWLVDRPFAVEVIEKGVFDASWYVSALHCIFVIFRTQIHLLPGDSSLIQIKRGFISNLVL